VLSSEELVNRIRKDSDYYTKYGGGITFSGGEPLLQGDFLLEVFSKIQDLHIAIETSGYADSALFSEVLGKLDFVMMDLKVMDPQLHKRYIGVNNRVILENARTLCEGETPFVIRIPVIPGVTDSDENYRDTARFLKGAKSLIKVELLHYNDAAGAKYSMIQKEYSPDFDPERPPNFNQEIFFQAGIRSEVL
jgi:pyruvate formate lyase activating enzyme